MKKIVCCSLFIISILVNRSLAQSRDSLLYNATLENCIDYAMKHYPAVTQSLIDQRIVDHEIKSKLADWFPQLNFYSNYTNNFTLQSTKFGSQIITIGAYNTSTAQIALTQTIFDRDVLLARTSASDVRKQAEQLTSNTKININANVSKAFYDVLLSQKQIELLDTDLVLLQRSQKDAYNQYKGGLVDKIDYQRSTIALNNATAAKKISVENLKIKYSTLKLFMSYPPEAPLEIVFDTARIGQEVRSIDTTETVNYENRIEYQIFLTQRKLQVDNLRYYKWGFLPSVSAFGQYNFNYFSNSFPKLYNDNFPNSYAGISLSIPIFQGTKRIQQVKVAQLQIDRLDYDFVALKDSINAQYTQALSSYKANLQNFYVQKENLELAREVYNIIQLQYRQGIKTYLDVVTANNDLFTAQINYTNAAYQLLINKVDLQVALGNIKY